MKYIRNSQNNKIHKKLIEIPDFFFKNIDKNAAENTCSKNKDSMRFIFYFRAK